MDWDARLNFSNISRFWKTQFQPKNHKTRINEAFTLHFTILSCTCTHCCDSQEIYATGTFLLFEEASSESGTYQDNKIRAVLLEQRRSFANMTFTTVAEILLDNNTTQEHVAASHDDEALSVSTNYSAQRGNSVTDETTMSYQTPSFDPLINVSAKASKTLSKFVQNITESTSTITNHLTTIEMDNHEIKTMYTNTYDVTTSEVTTTSILDTSDTYQDSYVKNAWFWIFICIIVIAVLGNVVMCVLVRCDATLHHMTYYFVTSLSVLNILMSLTVMPLAIPVTMKGITFIISYIYIFFTNVNSTNEKRF